MRYATIAAAVIALTPIAAAAQVPVPELKPALPWWVANNIGQCAPTTSAMATLREGDAEPLFWAPLERIRGVGAVGQVWGVLSGDKGGDGGGWMVVIHLANGMTCQVSKGTDLPKWAAHIDGRPA